MKGNESSACRLDMDCFNELYRSIREVFFRVRKQTKIISNKKPKTIVLGF